MEQGSIQLVESEPQHLGSEGTNNGKEDLGGFKSNRNVKFNDLRFKMYHKGPFSIHLPV
jgi:hypothetical protein